MSDLMVGSPDADPHRRELAEGCAEGVTDSSGAGEECLDGVRCGGRQVQDSG